MGNHGQLAGQLIPRHHFREELPENYREPDDSACQRIAVKDMGDNDQRLAAIYEVVEGKDNRLIVSKLGGQACECVLEEVNQIINDKLGDAQLV